MTVPRVNWRGELPAGELFLSLPPGEVLDRLEDNLRPRDRSLGELFFGPRPIRGDVGGHRFQLRLTFGKNLQTRLQGTVERDPVGSRITYRVTIPLGLIPIVVPATVLGTAGLVAVGALILAATQGKLEWAGVIGAAICLLPFGCMLAFGFFMTLWVYRDRSQYLLDRVHALFRDAVVLDAVGPAALPPE